LVKPAVPRRSAESNSTARINDCRGGTALHWIVGKTIQRAIAQAGRKNSCRHDERLRLHPPFPFTYLLKYFGKIAPLSVIDTSGIQIASIPVAKPQIIAVAIAINITGVLLHYGSDAQKYFTLKYKKGLLTEGFFSRSRNPNYLGEILIYLSFAMLAQHWLPFVILGGFIAGCGQNLLVV
jgi:hypothetical protein